MILKLSLREQRLVMDVAVWWQENSLFAEWRFLIVKVGWPEIFNGGGGLSLPASAVTARLLLSRFSIYWKISTNSFLKQLRKSKTRPQQV